MSGERTLRIGWSQKEITPPQLVLIRGQFHARVSEGVRDPLTVTALALESVVDGVPRDHVVMVSCDLIAISDALRDAVRDRIGAGPPAAAGLDPAKVFLNATHTHTGPEISPVGEARAGSSVDVGVELEVMDVAEYVRFAADRIAEAVAEAWTQRSIGGISWGIGHAVVGYNRRWHNRDGVATMYGDTRSPGFSHIEGYEDHSVNLLFTWDEARRMTGVVVNLACPAQVSEAEYTISADYWHETRQALRRRFGDALFVLPQCSPAGDQSPHPIYNKAALERMLALKGRTRREEIAERIAAAASEVAAWMDRCIEWDPVLRHRCEEVGLPRRLVTEEELEAARKESEAWRERYEALKREMEKDPAARTRPRWYVDITRAYRRARWFERVAARREAQRDDPTIPVEVHVVRLGDVAFATNPFEYYLDFGIQIKAQSKAGNCFLVQLAGNGTYLPTERAAAAAGYGAVPASTVVGPPGGRLLAERTVALINALWEEAPSGRG